MLDLPQILLASNTDDGPFRFIGILVIIAIFIFGNVLQWLQKYQAQRRKLEAQRQATAAAAPQVMQRPTPRGASRPAGPSRGIPGRPAPAPSPAPAQPRRRGMVMQPSQPSTLGAHATFVVRKLAASLPSVPGANLPPRRPVPPPTRPKPAQKGPQHRPEIAQPTQPAGQDITAPQIGARAQAAPTRAGRIQAVLNPRSLKQVYILTEILRPPVALRDSTTLEP